MGSLKFLRRAAALGLIGGAIGAAPAAAAEIAVGVTAGADPRVVTFSTDAPGTTLTDVPIQGLNIIEEISGMDQRTATGQFFVLTTSNQPALLDPYTGALTRVGSSIDTGLMRAGVRGGMEFNPTVDRLRWVDTGAPGADSNMRYNPVTFAPIDADGNSGNGVTPDADLAFIASDDHAGDDPTVVAEGYDRNDTDGGTASTLFALDAGYDILLRQGAVDGNAGDIAGGGSPNGGLLTTIGPVGQSFDDGTLDIVYGSTTAANIGYAALHAPAATGSTLHTINLATGAATPVGAIAAGELAGIAIARGGGVRAVPGVAGEAAGSLIFRIERDSTLYPALEVQYRTVDGTAIAGSDYTSMSGSVSFAQGEKVKEIAVPIAGDGTKENVESFALDIMGADAGAIVRTGTATGLIVDDDKTLEAIVSPVAPRSLGALRRAKRIRSEVSCSIACTITQTLLLGRTTLGTGTASLAEAGVAKPTITLSKSGQRRLKPYKKRFINLTVRSVLESVAGKYTLVKKLKLPLR